MINAQPIKNVIFIRIWVIFRPYRSIRVPPTKHPSAIGSAAIDAIQLESDLVICIVLFVLFNCGKRMAEYPDVKPEHTVKIKGADAAIH